MAGIEDQAGQETTINVLAYASAHMKGDALAAIFPAPGGELAADVSTAANNRRLQSMGKWPEDRFVTVVIAHVERKINGKG